MARITGWPDVLVVVGAAEEQSQAVVDLDVGGRVPTAAEPADSTPLPVDFPAEPCGPTPSAAHSVLAVADRSGVPSLADLAVAEGAPGATGLGDAVAVETGSREKHDDLKRRESRGTAPAWVAASHSTLGWLVSSLMTCLWGAESCAM